jgi:Protein of unknown function (DUF2975)
MKDHFMTAPTLAMLRIRRTSRLMVWACTAIVILLPIALVVYWATTSAADLAVQGNLPASAMQAPLQVWQRLAAAAATAVPLAMLLLGVWQVKLCFEQFAQGSVFTAQATAHLRRFAGWVAAAALAAIAAGTVVSILLTLNNAPGMRHVALGISSNHVFTLFFAALVWVMADVISQGQALAEENERFI